MGKAGKGKTVDEEVKRNARRGVLLMRQAAEAGSRKAMFHMGELLLYGHAPAELKPDHDEAAYMLLKTDADDAPALLKCIDADKVQRARTRLDAEVIDLDDCDFEDDEAEAAELAAHRPVKAEGRELWEGEANCAMLKNSIQENLRQEESKVKVEVKEERVSAEEKAKKKAEKKRKAEEEAAAEAERKAKAKAEAKAKAKEEKKARKEAERKAKEKEEKKAKEREEKKAKEKEEKKAKEREEKKAKEREEKKAKEKRRAADMALAAERKAKEEAAIAAQANVNGKSDQRTAELESDVQRLRKERNWWESHAKMLERQLNLLRDDLRQSQNTIAMEEERRKRAESLLETQVSICERQTELLLRRDDASNPATKKRRIDETNP